MSLLNNNHRYSNSCTKTRILCALWLLTLLSASICRADAFPESNVIAHASDEMLWVAQVLPAPEMKPAGERTAIRYRALNAADQSWHELPTIDGVRVVQIANRGQTAVVLTKTGEWRLVWPDGSSTGPMLPRHAKMVALASERDRNTLYAVGLPNAQATTESSDTASTEPAPATQSQIDPDKPILYVFEGVTWRPLANCPDSVINAPGEVSLAVISRMPTLAQPDAGGAIHVYQFDEDNKWIDRGAVKPPEPALDFRLIGGEMRPVLWIGEKDSGGLLYLGGEKWEQPKRLALSRTMSPVNSSLVSAAGALRLFIADDKGKLFEQRFENNGNRIGDLAPLPIPMPLFPPGYDNWPMFAILGAIALMMLSSTRRRSAAGAGDREAGEIVLATPGQRLMAGLIDAVPIVLSVLYVANNSKPIQDPTDISWIIPIIIAVVVYLLHTTLSELVSARTIGKILVGLEVVAINGKPAKAGAILIRNALRLIDVFPVPLALLIITSPMKQRLGDLLAGTIVVITSTAESEDDDEES